jgi:uncharacterized RDD family membrane protein YckC
MTDKPPLPVKAGIPPKRGSRDDAPWPEETVEPLRAQGLLEGVVARRIVAYILDGIFISLLALVAWFVLSILTALTFGLASPLLLLLPLLALAYHSLTIGTFGATPGMQIFDIEVRLLNGMRPDLPQALLLTVVFYATVWFTAWLVLLVALLNPRRRCVHDFLTGTLVLRSSVLIRGAW